MAGLTVHFEVLNQLNTPTLYADTLALRPAPAIVGRIFFRTDSPFGIYRDTGTAWDLVASPDTTGISGSGAAGQVPYFTGASTIAGTNNFFWDAANNRLGIGTATPGAHLDVHGTGTIAQFNGTGTTNSFISFQNAGVGKWRLGNNYSGGTNYFSIFDQTNTGEIVKIESGTTALNGINTLNAASFNNYTLTGIAAATTINNNRFISNYTFNAGITRTTIAEIGTRIESINTFSGSFTKSNDGQQSALFSNLVFELSGNFTQNQPATYLQTPTSIQSGATFTGAFTVSHFSNTRLAPWISATPTTITNAYQLVINNLSAFSAASLSPTYTNRWGIYQDGASDSNYFAGKLLLGTNTVSTFLLDVNGTSRMTGQLTVTGSTTAASAIARGVLVSSTLVAAANNDVLVALDIQPTFTNGAFTGVGNYAARFNGTFGSNATTLNINRNLSSNNSLAVLYADNSETSVINTASTASIRFTLSFVNYGRFFATTGNLALQNGGTYTDIASARLAVNSTTQGFLPPRMTTAEKNAIGTPAAGLIIFDTTLAKLCVYSGAGWETITSI